MRMNKYPVLLYDATCGFCDWSVQFVLRHDRKARFRFASLQGEYGQSVIKSHHNLERLDTVILILPQINDREKIYFRSAAVLRILIRLDWPWKLFALMAVVPAPIRDRIYDLFARNRHRFFGRNDHCLLPSPENKSRFLDMKETNFSRV